jgi:small basic protein (TIGR04137 family)
MSIHPSLEISDKDKKQRSVLKRTERLKIMMEKGKWKEGDPVFGLPKIKTVRIKIKKEKAEKAETSVATTTEATTASPTETKEQAASPTKGPAAKGQDKK